MQTIQPTVLLLSQEGDGHISPVQEAVVRLGGRALYCDLADFPERIQLSAQLGGSPWNGKLIYQDQIVALEDIKSIWWRRPQNYHAPADYAPTVRAFLDREAYRGFLGLLLGVPGSDRPFWVSRPNSIWAAEFKPSQLAAAQMVGLSVPKTLLTNDPASVTDFYTECQGRVICKAVWRGLLDPESDLGPGQERFIYTNELRPEHLAWLDGVRATAHLFQEQIAKATDLRVVIMGRQIFAIEIHSQHAERSRVDWRRSYADLKYAVHQLPVEIEQKLLSLMRLFELQYSSMDLILTPEGEYVWLEENPNGQFYWLEGPTGLPMAEAMANLLLHSEEFGL
jgi:hypothetical protein